MTEHTLWNDPMFISAMVLLVTTLVTVLRTMVVTDQTKKQVDKTHDIVSNGKDTHTA